ncbi:MAG TPA: alternative ribosome rescue aminoacyl-tRNA hydrolase ArfB [Oscillatoriaceae cyanobacterium]
MADLFITSNVSVPEQAIELRAVRSGGPGGQHVNKVSSKVELRVPLDAVVGLSNAARHRLTLLAGRRLTAEGVLVLTSSESRHQFDNRQEVERKLVELIRESLVAPKVRKATRPTKGSQERRLESKKRHASKKSGRGRFEE